MVDVPVNEQVPSVVVAVATNGQVVFGYNFRADEAGDMRAEYRPLVGDPVPLVGGVDFTVSGLGTANGGTITLVSFTATVAGAEVAIFRQIPIARQTDYARDLFAVDLNAEQDEIYMIMQQLSRDVDRALKVDIGDAPPSVSEVLEASEDAVNAAVAALAAANSNYTFPSIAAAAAAIIPSSVTIIAIAGPNGGPFTSVDNGSADTFTSNAGARTWYRVQDVGLARINGGARQIIETQNRLSAQDWVQNNAAVPPAIKLVPKPGSAWDKGIFQGFCYAAINYKFYSVWDASGAVSVMRQNEAGAFEIASADASAYIDHGQTLGQFIDRDGVFWLYSAGVGGRHVVFFQPPVADGGAITNVRTFEVFPAVSGFVEGVAKTWVSNTPGPCADGAHLVTKAWDESRPTNPYFARIYDMQALLDGADGDRSSEFKAEVNITPRSDYFSGDGSPVQQAIAADDRNIYVGQSTDTTSDTAFHSCFSIATGKRRWRRPFVVGKAFAATKGAGIRHELEGYAWVPNGAGVPKLWCGIRTRNNDNTGSDMYVMPLEAHDIASLGAARGPLQAGLWLGGQTYDILVPFGEVMSMSGYPGPDGTPSGGFQFSASLGRSYSLENHYVGTNATLFPSSASDVIGINLLGALGRVVVSANGLLGNWQRQASDGAVHEFRRGTSLVGSISVTTSATAYNTSSDETWKKFIGKYDPDKAIEIIKADPVRDFHWDKDHGGGYAIGWGAQTSHAVSPDLATPGGWFDPLTGAEWEEGASRWADPITGQDWVAGASRWVNPETFEPWVEGASREGRTGSIIKAQKVEAILVRAEYRPWGIDQSKRTPYLWAAVSRLIEMVEDLKAEISELKKENRNG